MKSWFDQSLSSNRELQVGDLVLKWDKVHEDKVDHTKFQKLWLGPFVIVEKIGPSTFRLQTLEGQFKTFPVNGLILKNISVNISGLKMYIICLLFVNKFIFIYIY